MWKMVKGGVVLIALARNLRWLLIVAVVSCCVRALVKKAFCKVLVLYTPPFQCINV